MIDTLKKKQNLILQTKDLAKLILQTKGLEQSILKIKGLSNFWLRKTTMEFFPGLLCFPGFTMIESG
jgi:hypothetical protein